MQKYFLKKWIIKSTVFLTVLGCLLAPEAGLIVRAQTGGFSIRAVIPDNQLDTRQTYFDLRMKPGDEQTVQFVITNSRAEELVAEVWLNAASTGRNGLIVYTEPNVRDESLKTAVTDVAALQSQKVTVPPNGSRAVDIRIKMPEDPYDGVILGGIAVTAEEYGDNDQTQQGISLKNNITYVIALKLTENDNEVEPDFDLTAITPSLVNYRTAVVATLHNKAARIAQDMEIGAQITRKGSDTVLYELTLSGAEMAPLSKGDFVIDWEGEALKPGTYRLRMTADYEDRTWEWDEEFTIGGEAEDLNNGAVGLKRDYRWLYLLVGLAVLALVWIIAYRMGKNKKKADED